MGVEIKKMIEAEFMQIAEKAILEKNTNQLSMINIIHMFATFGFPTAVHQFSFVLRTKRDISKDPSEVELVIKIHQDDNELLSHNVQIGYDDKSTNNLAFTINGLLIPKPEPLVFTCIEGNRVLGSLEIEIKHIEPEIKKEQQGSG